MIILVPRRNIETWFAYIDGESIDETLEYRAWKSTNPRPLADKLYRMCHEAQQLRDPAPPSLEESCREYRKLQH